MMNTIGKNYSDHLKPGISVRGKWHHTHYVILRKLGSGTVGTVYLCETNGRQVALKISEQSSSITIEVNVLKALKKVQKNHLGPYLLDVDDWVSPSGQTYSFYAMEYLEGKSLVSFVHQYGYEWMTVLMLQLLTDLHHLHKSGWVFGDLKVENLIILTKPPKIRLIDVGGMTQIGRAVKEYTAFYDRGHWGLGSRVAEPSYDLFAFVMVFLTVFYPNKFPKTEQPKEMIFKQIDDIKELQKYSNILKHAIKGKYQSSEQMRQDLIKELYQIEKQVMPTNTRYQTKTSFFLELGGILLVSVSYYLSSMFIP